MGELTLTIILTSYNRPYFAARALESLRAQTDPRWTCIVQDDGSDARTLRALRKHARADARIQLRTHDTTDEARTQRTRYAVLINEVLPELEAGVVGYMCDNAEYAPAMVGTVLDWFDAHPKAFSGFVLHRRDVWTRDGARLGNASDFGHWDWLPPAALQAQAITKPRYRLDHSQVFHRLPCAVRWEEAYSEVKRGDAIFFERLVAAHGPIYSIAQGQALSLEHLLVATPEGAR